MPPQQPAPTPLTFDHLLRLNHLVDDGDDAVKCDLPASSTDRLLRILFSSEPFTDDFGYTALGTPAEPP